MRRVFGKRSEIPLANKFIINCCDGFEFLSNPFLFAKGLTNYFAHSGKMLRFSKLFLQESIIFINLPKRKIYIFNR